MENEFDPYTFSSSIQFTGNPVLDDFIALALFIGAIAILIGAVNAWNNFAFGKYCLKVVLLTTVLAIVLTVC